MEHFLQTAKILQPAPNFRWRDRHGTLHDPKNMLTRHLFYTLKMIWNHSMPGAARLLPYKSYSFGSSYSREYMVSAVRALAVEISKREDIWPDWQKQIDHMIAFLSTKQIDMPGGGK